jgi:AraC family ethanolamine operon transcriptional activator
MAPAQGFHLQGRFDDAEEFCEVVREWELTFRQLEPGPFEAQMLQAISGPAQLGYARFNRRLEQTGSAPLGVRTFIVPADAHQHMLWRGQILDSNKLAVFPQWSEMHLVSPGNFNVFAPSYSEVLLRNVAKICGLPDDLVERMDEFEVTACSPSEMHEVRRALQQLYQGLRNDPNLMVDRNFRFELDFEVPRRLMQALARTRVTPRSPRLHAQSRAVRRAKAYIQDHAAEAITLRDLCEETGIDERTLRYAFLERYGILPKDYLHAFRLNGARKALRTADPQATNVSDVACAWGFDHRDRFDHAYRALFAEPPTKALSKSPRTS